jgi:hypothetical protein
MIIEAQPTESHAASGLSADANATESAWGNDCLAGGNSGQSAKFTWHVLKSVIQGEVIITPRAGASDQDVLAAEDFAFEQLQAAAAEESLDFWFNPEEDIYEDE